MGSNKIPTRSDGSPLNDSWWNALKKALVLDMLPRRLTDGDPEDEAGELGTGTHRWHRCYRTVSPPVCGQFKWKYDYNGTVTIEAGWMKCDGRVINQANYDAEHGAGAWVRDIGSSPLDGKYLPNITSDAAGEVFIRTKPAATLNGVSAIPTDGARSVSVSHTHTGSSSGPTKQRDAGTGYFDTSVGSSATEHTHTVAVTALSSSKSIIPESLVCKVYMRIIA